MARKKKFVGCAVQDCVQDQCVEARAQRGEKLLAVPACTDHALVANLFMRQIEEGVELDKVHVRWRGAMCFLDQSELFEVSGKPLATKERKRVIAGDDWSWTDEMDRWRNAEGKVVRIGELCDKEMEDAVVAIRKTNIQRRTKRIEWAATLEEISSKPQYVYPEEALKVDIDEAYAKIEEFYEEFAKRGILP